MSGHGRRAGARCAGRPPADLTTLVGRGREVRDTRAMLGQSRLVTITGPGGVGKSRVAVQVARSAERAFGDGVWFVDLSGLHDAALLPAMLATALGEDGQAIDQLVTRMADSQMLLVFDNCEHLISACTELVTSVLHAAPRVRILIGSRERLGLAGEHVLQVSPLDVPEDDEPVNSALLAGYDSVQLLVERAKAVRPDFEITPANTADVVRLSRRLDGLPLAIELAAAQLSTMSVGQIASRLDDTYRILKSPARGLAGRQTSLQDTIAWSYELCSAGEQTLWSRMSVFAGSVESEAIEFICADVDLAADDVPETLAGLVSKSIVVCEHHARPQFRMLDAIRHYGRQRLDPALWEQLTARHVQFYQRMACEAAERWFGPEQLVLASRLRTALPDLRLALGHALGGPEPQQGVRMAADLSTLWLNLGRPGEAEIWLQRALASAPTPEPRPLWLLGWTQLAVGETQAGRESLERALVLAEEEGDLASRDHAAALLAAAEAYDGDAAAAANKGLQALESRRAACDRPAIALMLMLLGQTYHAAGACDQAVRCYEECQALCESAGDLWCLSYVHLANAFMLCLGERYVEAAESARASLAMKAALDDLDGIMMASEVLCWTMAALGRWRDAAGLYTAITSRRESKHTPLRDFGLLARQRALWAKRIEAAIEEDHSLVPAASGVGLSVDEIARLADDMSGGSSHVVDSEPSVPGDGLLSRREAEVAGLVASGLSNAEIAARLVISRRTAEAHVGHILVKLGFTNRMQITNWWRGAS